MTIVRIQREIDGGREETDFSCSHVVKRFLSDRTELELCFDAVENEDGNRRPQPSQVLQLPRDGDVAYIMDNEGNNQPGGRVLPPRGARTDQQERPAPVAAGGGSR